MQMRTQSLYLFKESIRKLLIYEMNFLWDKPVCYKGIYENVNQAIDICINYFKTQSSKLMGNWQVMDSTNYYNNSKLYFVLNKKK